MSARRPDAVLAHLPGVELFSPADLDRIDDVVNLLDRAPLGSWSDERAPELLRSAEVLIGHWGCPPLDDAFLTLAPRLGLFAYAAGTVKNTVGHQVFERGIRVTSGARANAEPVAEFTLAAILLANKGAFWRRLQARDLRPSGPLPSSPVPVGNWDKRVGIVAASMVGRRVIELLAAFPAIEILVYDPYLTDAEARAMGVTATGLDELCAAVDVLSIHAPDLPATRHLIGAGQLALLRDGATVINTARPAVIDQEALTKELRQGRLWAILDVTEPEPLPADHELARLPNAFVTPHLAGSEGSELDRMIEHLVDELRRWVGGEPGANEVRADQLDRLA